MEKLLPIIQLVTVALLTITGWFLASVSYQINRLNARVDKVEENHLKHSSDHRIHGKG